MMTVLFNRFLIASLLGSGFILLTMLLNRFFRFKISASWHYYLWTIVLIRLLVPIFIAVPVSTVQSTIVPLEFTQQFVALQPADDSKIVYPVEADEQTMIPATHIQPESAFKLNFNWLTNALPFTWLLLTCLIFFAKIVNSTMYLRKIKSTNESCDEVTSRIFEMTLREIKMKTRPKIFINEVALSPFTIGLFNPFIILPAKSFSEEQLRLILQHELNHIKRKDLVLKWFFELAKAVHWFNPMVYIAAKRVDFYCELSCDEIVLKGKNEFARKEYGMTMISVISQAINSHGAVDLSMSGNKLHLKQRLVFIMNHYKFKKNLGLTFFLPTLIVGLFVLSSLYYTEKIDSPPSESTPSKMVQENQVKPVRITKSLLAPPKKTSFLLAGLDEDQSLTDTIIVGSFDTDTKTIKLLSIPRDTYLEMSPSNTSKLEALNLHVPTKMKLSAVNSYAKDKNGMPILTSEIEQMLGIKIDYYAKLDLTGFRSIVDYIGGVEVEVPEGGMLYHDPLQNLSIDIPGGSQLLDGKDAEGFVRFRATYPRGDLQRIEVQQQFLKQCAAKIFSKERPVKELSTLLVTIVKNAKTNISIENIAGYMPYITDIKAENLEYYMLPGEVAMIEGASYWIGDEQETKELVDTVFVK